MKNLFLLFSFSLMLTSCYVTKIPSAQKTQLGSNEVYKLYNFGWADSHLNTGSMMATYAIGAGGGAVAGGVVAGPIGAVCGGVLGAGLSTIPVLVSVKKLSQPPFKDYTEEEIRNWVSIYDKNLIYVANSKDFSIKIETNSKADPFAIGSSQKASNSAKEFWVIRHNTEESFAFRVPEDVEVYRLAFPKSTREQQLMKAAMKSMLRNNLPEFANLYESSPFLKEIKQEYINRSTNLAEFIEGIKRYPNTESNPPQKALLYVKSLDDTKTYYDYFRDNKVDAEKKGLEFIPSLRDIEKYISIFTTCTFTIKLQEKGLEILSSLKDIEKYLSLFTTNNYTSQLQVKGLSYSQSMNDILYYLRLFPLLRNTSNVEVRSVEIIKTIDDLKTFKTLFPKSEFSNSLVSKLIPTFNQSSLEQLIVLYPGANDIEKAKIRYISLSTTIDDFIAAITKYPTKEINIPKTYNYKEVTAIKEYNNKVASLENVIGYSCVQNVTSSLKDKFLNSEFESKYYSISSLLAFRSFLEKENWLEPHISKYDTKAYDRIDYLTQRNYLDNNSALSYLLKYSNGSFVSEAKGKVESKYKYEAISNFFNSIKDIKIYFPPYNESDWDCGWGSGLCHVEDDKSGLFINKVLVANISIEYDKETGNYKLYDGFLGFGRTSGSQEYIINELYNKIKNSIDNQTLYKVQYNGYKTLDLVYNWDGFEFKLRFNFNENEQLGKKWENLN